jgi:hypothetical protein
VTTRVPVYFYFMMMLCWLYAYYTHSAQSDAMQCNLRYYFCVREEEIIILSSSLGKKRK